MLHAKKDWPLLDCCLSVIVFLVLFTSSSSHCASSSADSFPYPTYKQPPSSSLASLPRDQGYVGSDLSNAAATSSSSEALFVRGCECWIWPNCISNCTFNEVLRPVLERQSGYLAQVSTPFIIAFPYQSSRGRADHTTSTVTKQGDYALETKFWITMFHNVHIQLILQRSQIHDGNKDFLLVYTRYENSKEVESDRLDRCFYTGKIYHEQKVDESSYTAVDTCSGLRGLIHLANVSYGIEPLPCASCNSSQPHVIFPLHFRDIDRDIRLNNTFWRPHTFISMSMDPSGSPDVPYVMRMAFFVDKSLFSSLGNSTEAVQQYVSRVLNLATKSFTRLSGYTLLLRMSYLEVWTQRDRIQQSLHFKSTMNSFVRYSVGMNRVHMRVLLSKTMFVEDVEYLAIPDSVCTPSAAAVIQISDEEDTFHTSRLLSLAIAEHMGLKSFPCPDLYPCSSKDILSIGDTFRLKLAFISGVADCLQGSEAAGSSMKLVNACGNGRVDRGEECDTGGENNSTISSNSCCDSRTCLAADWAECVQGGCCYNCTLLPRGNICRPAHDDCDLPEFCPGDRGECPGNLQRENGSPCDSANALCYNGVCPSKDAQCQRIWGSGAREADVKCYEHFNNAPTNKPQHMMCATLHCQGGQLQPLPSTIRGPGDRTSQLSPPFFINNIGSSNRSLITCKYLGPGSQDRNVFEGTPCSKHGHFCFGSQCIDPKLAIRSRCPSSRTSAGSGDTGNFTCSGQGICTNLGKCLCKNGWEGDRCDQVSNQTDTLLHYLWLYVRALQLTKQKQLPPHTQNQILRSMDDILLFLAQQDTDRGENGISVMQMVGISAFILFFTALFFLLAVICYKRRTFLFQKSAFSAAHNGYQRSCDFTNHPNYFINKEKWERANAATATATNSHNSNKRGSRRPSRTKHFRVGSSRRTNASNAYPLETSSFDGDNHQQRFSSQRALSDPEEQGGNISSDSNTAAERMIKFGSMPSYRQDKTKQAASVIGVCEERYVRTSPPSKMDSHTTLTFHRNSYEEPLKSASSTAGDVDSPLDMLALTNASRHPEKGILKNKQPESTRSSLQGTKVSLANSLAHSSTGLSSTAPIQTSTQLGFGGSTGAVSAVVVNSSSTQFSSSDQTNTTTSSSQSSISSEGDDSEDEHGTERGRRSATKRGTGRRGRHEDDENDETFVEENVKPPVILCNAANQTDETSLLVDTHGDYEDDEEDNDGGSSDEEQNNPSTSGPSTLPNRGGSAFQPGRTAVSPMATPYHTSDVSMFPNLGGRETPPPLPNPSNYVRLKCEANGLHFPEEAGRLRVSPAAASQQHKDLLMGQHPVQHASAFRTTSTQPQQPQPQQPRNTKPEIMSTPSAGNSTHSSSSPLLVQSHYSSSHTSPYAQVGLLDTLDRGGGAASGTGLAPPPSGMSLYPGHHFLRHQQPVVHPTGVTTTGSHHSGSSGTHSQTGDNASGNSSIYYNDPMQNLFRSPPSWNSPASKAVGYPRTMPANAPVLLNDSNMDLVSQQATINDEGEDEEDVEEDGGELDEDYDSNEEGLVPDLDDSVQDAFHQPSHGGQEYKRHNNSFNIDAEYSGLDSATGPPHLVRLGAGYSTNEPLRASGPSAAAPSSTRMLSPSQPHPRSTITTVPPPPPNSMKFSGFFPPPLSFNANPVSVNCLVPTVNMSHGLSPPAPANMTNRNPSSAVSPEQSRLFPSARQ